MMERLATFLGRRVSTHGVDRVLGLAYPCRHDSKRFVRDRRRRSDGLWMQLDTRTLIDWHLLFHGEWERHLRLLFEQLLGAGSVAIDVGANVGAHTLTLARLVGPNGRVLAFEPNPSINHILATNVGLNDIAQVTVYGCALGAAATSLELRVPAETSREASNPGLASLVALDTPHDLVTVDVRPLDDLVTEADLQRVDLVKIDVQGYESQVLQGMRGAIEKFSPTIIFEYEDWAWRRAGSTFAEVASGFGELSYSLWKIDAPVCRSRRGRRIALTPILQGTVPGTHADVVAMSDADPRVCQLQRAFGAERG